MSEHDDSEYCDGCGAVDPIHGLRRDDHVSIGKHFCNMCYMFCVDMDGIRPTQTTYAICYATQLILKEITQRKEPNTAKLIKLCKAVIADATNFDECLGEMIVDGAKLKKLELYLYLYDEGTESDR